MSTNDVPGAVAANNDELGMGCWAESAEKGDQSPIFVESTENDRVIFSVFDLSKNPITEYRDSMVKTEFEKYFSWNSNAKKPKWTWHDKTAFPWNRIIKAGATDGLKFASAADQLSAAERVREHLRGRAQNIDMAELRARAERTEEGRTSAEALFGKIGRALDKLIGNEL